jgi:type IV pilus assembly protein PilC
MLGIIITNEEWILYIVPLIAALILAALLVRLGLRSVRTAFWMSWIVPIVYLICGAMYASAHRDPSILALSIILSILLLLTGLIAIARGPVNVSLDKTPWPKTWAQWILKNLGFLAVLAFLLGVFNILGLLLFAMFTGAMLTSGKSGRRTQTLEIVSTLALCVRQNLPMPMALRTAALYQKSGAAAAMERIAHWLVQGYPLGQSLRNGWPQGPKDVLDAVEAGEKIGQLPRTFETLMADLSEKEEQAKNERSVDLTYPAVILTAASLIVIAICVFVFPTFAQVLYDVTEGKEVLPLPTRILIDVSGFLTSRKGLPAVLIVLVPVAIYGVFSILYRLWRRRRIALRDWLQWHLPLRRGYERRRCLRQLIGYLQAALRAGLDLPQALRQSLALDLNQCYKNRIVRWTQRIEAGQPAGPAAQSAGMGRELAWAFSEPNLRNLPAVLTMIDETTQNKTAYRDNWIRSVSFPLIILLLGGTVGFIMLAFFLPMIQIISIYTMSIVLP